VLEISAVGPGLDILHQHIAVGAFHNSAERFDPPKCYPKTREAIIEKIEAWVKERPENGDRLVMWMYGPAGAGKSAIAQSIAELCEALLAASFFFSRTAAGRSDSSRLVATIVWQLILSIPEIRDTVLCSLERDPTLLTRLPATQMKCLIVDPLNAVPKETLIQRPRLIIVDGLDECLPPESQDDILKFISISLRQLNTPIYFLIASRPHSNIRDAFVSNLFRAIIHTLPLEYDSQSIEDIRHFIASRFKEIRCKHPYLPRLWPPKDDIEALVGKSSSQFIYAATVIRYIGQSSHGHEKRLRITLNLQPPDNSATPFAMLDALYLQIFRSVGEDQIAKVMEILSALICLTDNKIHRLVFLEELFKYRKRELASVMEDIRALVRIPDDRGELVEIYHASLPDFLLDFTRSRTFFLDPATVYVNLAQHCIKNGRCKVSGELNHRFWYLHAMVFSECMMLSPLTIQLSKLLSGPGFSMWDCLPAQHAPLFSSVIGDRSIALLEKFRVSTRF
jgi:hypothetical protein